VSEYDDRLNGAEQGPRLRELFRTLGAALSTRGAILRAEAKQKIQAYLLGGVLIAVAAACVAVAAVLVAALLVVVFSSLLRNLALAVALTLLLYLAAAVALTFVAIGRIKALPTGFPRTRDTLKRDFSALDAALGNETRGHLDDEEAQPLD
jgi:Putative Actinobacterial Holin-X, holin superfamily III